MTGAQQTLASSSTALKPAAVQVAWLQRRAPRILLFAVLLLFGLVFTVVDMIVVYVLTRGGPFDSTQVLASLAYFTGIDGGDLAEGAAIALFLFPVLVAVAILFLQIARRAEVT